MTGTGRSIAALATALLLASCAGRRPAPTADPAVALMVSDRLFFGRDIPGGGMVSDEEWASFLQEIVTPRFPQGLTVWRADGQWLDEAGRTVGEPVLVVEVLHPPGAEHDRAMAEIADEYARRFRQEAVLRVTIDARSRLFEQEGP
ncbi:MAG TPA: DUF3574 domain-containing protein [Gemmatimonadota bacterium]|nr:DUF3574 domain-containing protein [Gemmatimonadota bacterium]